MEIVLGLAKGHLDLKGGKWHALELDLRRLVYAKQRLEARGDVVHAFLAVMTQDLRDRCEAWAANYDARGAVEVLVVECTSEQAQALRDEKARNISGMIAGSQGLPVGLAEPARWEDSEAGLEKVIAEDYLDWYIEKRFGSLTRVERESEMPFGIGWDYCGRPRPGRRLGPASAPAGWSRTRPAPSENGRSQAPPGHRTFGVSSRDASPGRRPGWEAPFAREG